MLDFVPNSILREHSLSIGEIWLEIIELGSEISKYASFGIQIIFARSAGGQFLRLCFHLLPPLPLDTLVNIPLN